MIFVSWFHGFSDSNIYFKARMTDRKHEELVLNGNASNVQPPSGSLAWSNSSAVDLYQLRHDVNGNLEWTLWTAGVLRQYGIGSWNVWVPIPASHPLHSELLSFEIFSNSFPKFWICFQISAKISCQDWRVLLLRVLGICFNHGDAAHTHIVDWSFMRKWFHGMMFDSW